MTSRGQNLQPFTGNGDVSKWVKILQWDENLQTTNKQSIPYTMELLYFDSLVHVSWESGLNWVFSIPSSTWMATKWSGPSHEIAKNEVPCHSRFDTIKIPPFFSSARQRSIYFATLYRQWCRLHLNETSLARYKTTENGQPVPYKCASLKIVFKSSLILPNCVGKPKWSGTIFWTNRKRVSMFCNIHVTEIITQSSLTCNNKVS